MSIKKSNHPKNFKKSKKIKIKIPKKFNKIQQTPYKPKKLKKKSRIVKNFQKSQKMSTNNFFFQKI